jgi:Family of unknown function (DUF695)
MLWRMRLLEAEVGQIVDAGSGRGGMDVFVEVMNAAEARPKVIAILEKLGLTSRAKVSVADTQGLGAATGTYQAQDWTNTVGLLDDQELHVRRNASLEAEDSHAFPYTILVSLIYQDADPTGRPSSREELVRLDRTEEAIADVMQASCSAQYGLAVTGGGTRELFFFVRELPTDERVEELIQSIAPEVDYRFERLQDPDWQPYRGFLDRLSNRVDQ